MILMIDNYDSFTYNIVQYLGELGVELKVWRNDQFSMEDVEALNPKAIVVSPGPCSPNEAGKSLQVFAEWSHRLPIFGVCLGHQCLGQHFGGNVIHADRLMHGMTSPVHHFGDALFHGVENPFIATRYHSLIVERSSLPSCLSIIAETAEGEIMALRHNQYPVYGVQFHPESYATGPGKNILRNFLRIIHYPGIKEVKPTPVSR